MGGIAEWAQQKCEQVGTAYLSPTEASWSDMLSRTHIPKPIGCFWSLALTHEEPASWQHEQVQSASMVTLSAEEHWDATFCRGRNHGQ